MTLPEGPDAVFDIEGVQDPFVGAIGSEIRAAGPESPLWLQDIDSFQLSHSHAMLKTKAALAKPTQETLDHATEAIIITRKNGELLFEKEFFRDYPDEAPTYAASAEGAAILPLRAAVGAVARACEDLDGHLNALFPLKIPRDPYSTEDLEEIMKRVKEGADEREALEPLGRLTRKYSTLCNEMQDALKTPKVASSIIEGQKATITKSAEWKREAAGIGVASLVLFAATASGTWLAQRSKK